MQNQKPNLRKKNKTENLRVGLWNAQSIKLKSALTHDYMIEEKLDLLFVTESWLCEEGNEKEIGELEKGDFQYHHNPRKGRKGGGVAVIRRLGTNLTFPEQPNVKTMEILISHLNTSMGKITFILVYRPDKSKLSNFLKELGDIVAHHLASSADVFLIGDFNFHMNKPDLYDTKELKNH